MTREFQRTRSSVQWGDQGPMLLRWYCEQVKLLLLPREAIMLRRHLNPLAPGWKSQVVMLRVDEVCQ